MILIQNGYECERELKQFIKMFFDNDEDVLINLNFEYENKIINTYTVIFYKNKRYEEDYYFKFDILNKSDKLIKKIFTAACTKSFIHAAMKIRNVSLPWGVMCGIRPAKNVRELYEDNLSEEKIRKIFKDVYEVNEDKTDLAIEVYKNEKRIIENIKDDYVSIYIGIPFCPTRCLYCSFVSTDIRVTKKYMDDFCLFLIEEIKKTSQILKDNNLKIDSIYIGGGTPTALSEDNLELILKSVNDNFDIKNINEFTLEAGRADTINYKKLEIAKKYGVDRISINPQTMNDITLKKVGRHHTSEDVRKVFKIARDIGFKNINMDLIAGLPDEDFNMFKYSLDEIIKLNPENITVHSLCIKNGADIKNRDIEFTKSKVMNDMLSYTQKKMKETNRLPYYMYRQKNMLGNLENVGYSYKDKMSAYNINIMEEKQSIIALGGGGSTKLVTKNDIIRIFNFKNPKEYIERFSEILSKKDEISRILGGEKA